MQMWLGCNNSPCCWQGGITQLRHAIQTHGSRGEKSCKGLRESWDLQFETPGLR